MTFIPKAVAIITVGLAALVIDEKTGVSIGTMIAAGSAIAGSIWWTGRKFQSLEDKLENAQEWRLQVKEHLDKQDDQRLELIKKVEALPCHHCEFFAASKYPVITTIKPEK